MNLPYLIAKRISDPGENNFSSVIHKIAIASVAIGLAIMVISFLILGGFQRNIKDKLFSFAGHIQVTKFSLDNSYEQPPILLSAERMTAVKGSSYVRHVQEFANKPGLLTRNDEVVGVLFKGIGRSFDYNSLEKYMIAGEFITFNDSTFSTEVMLSEKVANDLALNVGDRVLMYFVQDPPRNRLLTIKGIYNTGLEDFDNKVIIGDIDLIRVLNNWELGQVGGYEVFLKDYRDVEEADNELSALVGVEHFTESTGDKYLQIFDWLGLLGQNVSIFIWLILFVACFNMVSVLFILIMERTQMIGMLKAMGATDGLVRRVFSYKGIRLILKGVMLGNVIGLGFGAIQFYFQLIPLDPQNYYMEYVPIEWNWPITILLNVLILGIISLVLFLPTTIISRVRPVKAIRFD